MTPLAVTVLDTPEPIVTIRGADLHPRCGGGTHAIGVGIDRLGRVRITLHDHDLRAEAVMAALGAEPTTCHRLALQLRGLHRHVADPRDRVEWVALGVDLAGVVAWTHDGTDPAAARAWSEVGVRDPRQRARWVAAGVTTPELARRWVDAGLTEHRQIADWALAGLAPDVAAAWRRAGVDSTSDAEAWQRAGVGVDGVPAWVGVGVEDGDEAARWRPLASSPREVRRFRRCGVVDGRDAALWLAAGARSCPDVRAWRALGVDAGTDAAWWSTVGPGRDLERMREVIAGWRTAGVGTGQVAAEWHAAGIDMDDLPAWREAKVGTGHLANGWTAAGVRRPEDVLACRSRGVSDRLVVRATAAGLADVRLLEALLAADITPADVERWLRAGITGIDDLDGWRGLGVEADEALRWVDPPFVHGLDEVAAWRAAGFTPATARGAADRDHLPGPVVAARRRWRDEVWHGSPKTDGRPAFTRTEHDPATGSDVRVEHYGYAFGRPVPLRSATHLITYRSRLDGHRAADTRRVHIQTSEVTVDCDGQAHVLRARLSARTGAPVFEHEHHGHERILDALGDGVPACAHVAAVWRGFLPHLPLGLAGRWAASRSAEPATRHWMYEWKVKARPLTLGEVLKRVGRGEAPPPVPRGERLMFRGGTRLSLDA